MTQAAKARREKAREITQRITEPLYKRLGFTDLGDADGVIERALEEMAAEERKQRDKEWVDIIQGAIGQWGGEQYKHFNEAMARIWAAKENFDKGLDEFGLPIERQQKEAPHGSK